MIVAPPRDNSQDSSVIFFIAYCSRQSNNFDKFAINEIHLCCTDHVGASKCKSSGQIWVLFTPNLKNTKQNFTLKGTHTFTSKKVSKYNSLFAVASMKAHYNEHELS